MDNERNEFGFPSEESQLLQELMMQEISAMSSEALAAIDDIPASPSGERDPLPASFADLLEQTVLDTADEDDEPLDEEDDELFEEEDEEDEDELPALTPAVVTEDPDAPAVTAAPKTTFLDIIDADFSDDVSKPDEKSDEYYSRIGCTVMAAVAVAIIALVWWLIASGILAAILRFLLKAAILIALIWWVIAKVFDL